MLNDCVSVIIRSGEPLVLLHGGLGNTDYWGGQIAAFSAKYKVINIASRGHGRSTKDDQAYSYHLMASDVLAVMDILSIQKASIVGWRDGGNISIDIAINNPDRLVKLFAFGANFNPSGVKPTVETDAVLGIDLSDLWIRLWFSVLEAVHRGNDGDLAKTTAHAKKAFV